MPHPAHVLVVDDDPLVLKLFEEAAQEAGFELHLANDAKEGRQFLHNQAFDVVVLDKYLPEGESGLQLLREQRARDPNAIVILITAYADVESAVEAIRGGAYDFIVKPFESLDELKHRLDRAITAGRLKRQNNELMESLRRANERIEKANQELEVKVAERTKQLEELSVTDDVTGLYNQRFLYERLDDEVQRSKRYANPLSVLMLDIDRFKEVNDDHDHLFGSQVLRRLGQLLLAQIRTVDRAIRYGGDEFTVILPETDERHGVETAERLRAAVEKENFGDEKAPCNVTISVGVACMSPSIPDKLSLLRAADLALYRAKETGRNRVCLWDKRGKPPPQ